jgi:ABC-2 type transport system permease protein
VPRAAQALRRPRGVRGISLEIAEGETYGLLGSLFWSEQQAGPVALLLGLGLAALGGSMAPLEVFPDTARAIAHVTPHAWANDAFSKLLGDGDGVGAVLPQMAVLLALAAVALVLATWRLRRAITA